MKNIAILAAAAAVMMSGSAFAATQSIVVNGAVTPQCAITATATTVTIAAANLADTDGYARLNVGSDVALALNGAGIQAWCTGATNGVVLSRTALLKGAGTVDASGFANGIAYDIAVKIPGALRGDGLDGSATGIEGTSDGAGFGPGVGAGNASAAVDSFGPTGSGVPVTFLNEGSSTSGAITTLGGVGPTGGFTVLNTNRLAAGNYTSTVTQTLTPGV